MNDMYDFLDLEADRVIRVLRQRLHEGEQRELWKEVRFPIWPQKEVSLSRMSARYEQREEIKEEDYL